MKKITHSLIALATAIVALGTASAQTIINDPVVGFAQDNNDADLLGNTFSDLGQTAATFVAGEINHPNRLNYYAFVEFELPSITAAQVQTATLSLYLQLKNDGGELDNLSVFHSITNNDFAVAGASDFENATFTDTGLDIVTPTSTTGQYFTIDVTSLIKSDLTNDGATAFSAFRLQMDTVNQVTLGANSYVFTGPGAGSNKPLLTITQVPEPNSFALLGAGLVGLLALRRRRQR